MGSLHNDIHTWAGRARARGQDTIEIDLQTADRIVAALARPAAPTQSAAQTGEVERLRDALEQIANPPYGLGFNKLRGIARKALSQPEQSQ